LGSQDTSIEALEAACVPHGGQTPDAVFLCAGRATPGFFIEQTEETLRKGMDDTYWLAAWSAMVRDLLEPPSCLGPLTFWHRQAASKRMVRTGTKGKIVFVSSVLGYFGLVGYSSYSPGKHAIRGKRWTNSNILSHVDNGVDVSRSCRDSPSRALALFH